MENSFFSSHAFKTQLSAAGRSPIARLTALSDILSQWNQQRICNLHQDSVELTIADINLLKDIVYGETSRLKLNNAEVVSDQILFMLIGAIKLQAQQNCTKPWTVVKQSIHNFTGRQKSKNTTIITLLFISLIVLFGSVANNRFKTKTPESPDVFRLENAGPGNNAGYATVSNLVALYQKMKEGSCQLPQAAMLQPQDREAFIAFVNGGKVEIGTAGNLENALGYVHCLYPQKLMDKPLQTGKVYS